MRSRFLLVLSFIFPVLLSAQETPAPAAKAKIHVLIKQAKPFAFEKDGAPVGYSVDLWRRVAEEANLEWDFKTVSTVPELIDGLKAQSADVGVGALSITAEREAVVEFSHPYYKSGLQILASTAGAKSPFRAFLKLDVLKVIILLLVAITVNAHILWFFERRKNPESFPQNYFEGILNAAWWSVSILVTLGCENIAPARVVGRMVAVVWMLAGVAFYSYVTATLTTTMTKDALQSDVRTLADLQGREIGTVAGSSSERFLQSQEMVVKPYPDVDSACRAMNTDGVKAVVYDMPLLKYYLSNNPTAKMELVGDLLEKQDYGFALPEQSPLRRTINRVLLKLSEEGFLDELDKKWFGTAQ